MAKEASEKASPKAKPKLTDAEQSERFIKTARELRVDESGKRFEAAIEKLYPSKDRKNNR